MNLLSFFWPQKIATFKSKFNGKIYVVEFMQSKYIDVGGLMQSGRFLETIFQKAFKKLSINSSITCNKILILGLGGGSVAKVFNKLFPTAQITGVDIDDQIVNAGKKYLNLNKIENLRIIIENAVNFVSKTNEKFDIILVDLYQGYKIPDSVQADNFLNKLKQIRTQNGLIVFNRLYFQKHVFEADKFLDKLKNLFHYVITAKIYSNLLICVK